MKKYLIIVLAAILIIPSVSFGAFNISLKYGSKGDAVSELQDFLHDQDLYSGMIDGKFFSGTLRAVKAFQVANNLPADGYFGRASRDKANELLKTDLADTAEQQELAATPPGLIAGCTTTAGFSTFMGHPCTSTSTLPAGCISISGFSPTTGLSCGGTVAPIIAVAPTPTPTVTPAPYTVTVSGADWRGEKILYADPTNPFSNYMQLIGGVIQIYPYHTGDTFSFVLKDGDTIIPETKREESHTSATYNSTTIYYSLPDVVKDYTFEATVNGVTKTGTANVNDTYQATGVNTFMFNNNPRLGGIKFTINP